MDNLFAVVYSVLHRLYRSGIITFEEWGMLIDELRKAEVNQNVDK